MGNSGRVLKSLKRWHETSLADLTPELSRPARLTRHHETAKRARLERIVRPRTRRYECELSQDT
jgi:hypothetical protein